MKLIQKAKAKENITREQKVVRCVFYFCIAIVYFPYHFLIGSDLLKDISSSIMSGQGQQQVKHVHSTYHQTSVIVDDQDNGKYNAEEKSNRLETAVIILSSLIPSHPSLWMLENVIKSLENLDGLHPNAPIYITVDAPKKDKLVEKAEELDEYTRALYRRFRDDENRHVTIVVNSVNRHVNGSIRKVVFDLINTNVTKYIYLLQHDLMFMPGKMINHYLYKWVVRLFVRTFIRSSVHLFIPSNLFLNYCTVCHIFLFVYQQLILSD
mmetsp:Transcript_58369/g.63016  ORF Transcript_58369/g.63016 Transcript_58369/m.63016 type:complete len:266 (+) Transcript_58369:162-959(+)